MDFLRWFSKLDPAIRLCLIVFIGLSLRRLFKADASVAVLRNMEGKGNKIEYANSYDQVWDATLNALKKFKGLDLVSEEKSTGVILALSDSFLSGKKNFAIFIRVLTPNSTSIEIISSGDISNRISPTRIHAAIKDFLVRGIKR